MIIILKYEEKSFPSIYCAVIYNIYIYSKSYTLYKINFMFYNFTKKFFKKYSRYYIVANKIYYNNSDNLFLFIPFIFLVSISSINQIIEFIIVFNYSNLDYTSFIRYT